MNPQKRKYPLVSSNEPKKVTEQMKRRYENVDDSFDFILETEFTHGSGIGAEPYGFQTTLLRAVVYISERSEITEDKCPNCGSEMAYYKYSSGRADCSPFGIELKCHDCPEMLYDNVGGI